MLVASAILSVRTINRLKLSTCAFFTYGGSGPLLFISFFMLDLRVRICWRKIWKNIASSTSPSPPRYSNYVAILSLIANNKGLGCALKLSMLHSMSQEYPRSRVSQSGLWIPVEHSASLTSTHERRPPVEVCSSSLSFNDRRKFFNSDCRCLALPSPPSTSAVRPRRRTFSQNCVGSSYFLAIRRKLLTTRSSSLSRSSLQCPAPSSSSSLSADASLASISQARRVSCMSCTVGYPPHQPPCPSFR